MRLVIAALLVSLLVAPDTAGQSPKVAQRPLPTVSRADVAAYRLTRLDGPIYIIRSFHVEGPNYVVEDIRGRKMQHLATAIASIEPLTADEARGAAHTYTPPGASSSPAIGPRTAPRTSARTKPRPTPATPERTMWLLAQQRAEDEAARQEKERQESAAQLDARIARFDSAPGASAPSSSGSDSSSRSSGTSSLCGATTKKGAPCQRRVKGGGHCYQHGG